MRSDADAMEKGQAGQKEGPLSSPCPTSPTLYNSATDSTTVGKSLTGCDRDSSPSPSPRNALCSWLRTHLVPRRGPQTPIVTRRLNDSPKGYPNVAAFLDSDEGFTIYRRYGFLQARLLLSKQEELRRLEQELERMDLMMTSEDEDALCSLDKRGQFAEKHSELLLEIENKFCSYVNILNAAQQMIAFGKPADADRESVGRYLWNRKSLVQGEGSWIHHKDDLITLRAGREHAWLDGVVETLLKVCHCRLIDTLFRSKETKKKTEIDNDNMPANPPKDEDKCELYYTPSRIARLTNCILTVMILTLLILPIYVLYHMVHDIGTRSAYMTCIGTLLVFTLAFSSVLSLFTKARRHEILAAAAAYCAVLVVFLGNVGPTFPNH